MTHREARLRPEFAHHYPYLTPERWESAAVLTDRIVAHVLGRPLGRFIAAERALDPEHFEFRGGEAGAGTEHRLRRQDPTD
ncbi:MAG: hypothetical protein H0W36_06230 [Gemmatimonadetes bacterium]|nr:hypothetical protein [Gemmatimonadota bacterium]